VLDIFSFLLSVVLFYELLFLLLLLFLQVFLPTRGVVLVLQQSKASFFTVKSCLGINDWTKKRRGDRIGIRRQMYDVTFLRQKISEDMQTIFFARDAVVVVDVVKAAGSR
jgi:hypothetical protein